MAIPDLNDTEKMALIGRQTVLRKARREAAQRIRDRIVPICNNFESEQQWDLSPVVSLIEEINQINKALSELG